MTFDEIKAAVMSLDDQGKLRVVRELLPAIWPKIVCDERLPRVPEEAGGRSSRGRIQRRAHGQHLGLASNLHL